VKKFLPHLLSAREQNLNEADTVQRIVKFLEVVLGYDAMTEITREMQVKDRYVDIALKVDDRVRMLIEVKAASTELRDRHIDQAERYAAENNLPWVLLTNGVVWNLYHLTFDEGIEYERAFSVDLSNEGEFDNCIDRLALLHRLSIRRDEHEAFWGHRRALSPQSISQALFTHEVLRLVRRDIRRREGLLVDEEDLAAAIHDMFSTETRERTGPLKIRRRRAGTRRAKPTEPSVLPAADSIDPSVLLKKKDVEPV
jgi:predicted type IV restriction endonuclease